MAESPDEVIIEWEKALLGGDLDALVDLYEDDAIYVVARMDVAARGKGEIRSVFEGLRALGEPLTQSIDDRAVTVDGDYAFAHVTGTLRVRWAESGQEEDLPVRATEVMHRGADGRWRYVIDHA